jgi:hypothetical protein
MLGNPAGDSGTLLAVLGGLFHAVPRSGSTGQSPWQVGKPTISRVGLARLEPRREAARCYKQWLAPPILTFSFLTPNETICFFGFDCSLLSITTAKLLRHCFMLFQYLSLAVFDCLACLFVWETLGHPQWN